MNEWQHLQQQEQEALEQQKHGGDLISPPVIQYIVIERLIRKAEQYVDNVGGITIVYDFGEMPDIFLWGHITDKLADEGLFAEVQEENCIFISWA